MGGENAVDFIVVMGIRDEVELEDQVGKERGNGGERGNGMWIKRARTEGHLKTRADDMS